MVTEVSLYQDKPRKFIAQLYEGTGTSCSAYWAVHNVLFNLIDAEVNTHKNANTGLWKDKEQSGSSYGLFVTITKDDLLLFITSSGYTEHEDLIKNLPNDKDYVIFADGD